MNSIDLSHFKQLYLQTSEEQLSHLEEGIHILLENAQSKEGFDKVYINAHTLVSKSILMGYTEIGSLSQKIEKLFFALKQQNLSVSSEILSAVQKASEGLHKELENIKSGASQIDLSLYRDELEKYFPKNV